MAAVPPKEVDATCVSLPSTASSIICWLLHIFQDPAPIRLRAGFGVQPLLGFRTGETNTKINTMRTHFIGSLAGIGQDSEDILREYGFANTWSSVFVVLSSGLRDHGQPGSRTLHHTMRTHFIVMLPFIDRHNVDSLRSYGFASTRSFSYRSAALGAA